MRIDNRTRWDTEAIRYVVSECCKMLGYGSEELDVAVTPRRWVRFPTHVAWRATAGSYREWIGTRRSRRLSDDRYSIILWLEHPRPDLDLGGEDHLERTVNLARAVCDALILAHNGAPQKEDREVPWLADWYEVNCSAKGRAAGCPRSPLVPAAVREVDPDEERAERFAHARQRLAEADARLLAIEADWATAVKKHETEVRRATTIRRRWAASVRGFENYEKRKGTGT